jgi:hypothetical protein
MNFTRDHLAKMTNIELMNLADEKLNLELSPMLKKVELIDEILQTQEEIWGPPDAANDPVFSRRFVNPVLFEKDRVRVKFHETHDEQGHMPVKAGINGRAYEWKRNVEIDLPRAILGVMDNAVETRFIPLDDNSGTIGNEKRKVARFPYTVVADPAPQAEEPKSEAA